jgi:DNA-nicking Smr family endonuclease
VAWAGCGAKQYDGRVSKRRDPEDEADEFERAMADVARLPADPRGRVVKMPKVPELRCAQPDIAADEVAVDAHVAPGVDRRELRRLKRGDYPVQGRLDLHGMTLAEARAAVAWFLDNGRHARHRCVCIIHGRGLNSAGGKPVLREAVREILLGAPSVLAFTSAPPSAGGDGAVYVLLRR